MAEPSGTSYDEVPYESQAFCETSPDRLATLAILHGLEPPDAATARVLELGCASGGNLIPLALAWPEARFLGVDLSERQIETGRALIAELGPTNIELRAGDLARLDPDLGAFDYIIVHGVYSWVTPEARERVLEVVARHLGPSGVAFVSYNTLPGWHISGMVREMMLYHIAPLADTDPAHRVTEARSLLETLVQAAPQPASLPAQIARRELEVLRDKADSYFFHEHLETENHPVYFHEFLDHAARHGLKYLSDARYGTTVPNQPPPLREAIERLAEDPLRREQYLDFFRNRTFRRSLLVSESAEVQPADASRVVKLRALTAAAPASPRPDPFSAAPEDFVGMNGQTQLTTTDPLIKTALMILGESWPRSLPVPELRSRALARLKAAPNVSFDRDPLALERALLASYALGLVDLHTVEPPFVVEIGDRPIANPYARKQAETGKRVANPRHRMVELSAFDRLVTRQLDGTRDRAEILDGLVAAVLAGTFPLSRDGQPIRDAMEVRAILDRSLDPSLARLRGSALLTG